MRIKDLCIRSGKTQIDISRYLGISPSTLSQYANGNRCPTPDTIIKIADYFGVTTDYLLEHDDMSLTLAPLGYDRLTDDDKNAVDYLILRLAGGIA